ENNALLFVLSGSSSVVLDVFDTSGIPTSIPSTPIQSIPFASAGNEIAGLDLSPDNTKLALLLASDSSPTLTLYDINVGAAQPLTQTNVFNLTGYSGFNLPNDVHFAQDGTFVLVSAGNGLFTYIDLTTTPPSIPLNA